MVTLLNRSLEKRSAVLTVTGSFQQVLAFLQSLEQLEVFVVISEMNVQRQAQQGEDGVDRAEVEMELTLSAYGRRPKPLAQRGRRLLMVYLYAGLGVLMISGIMAIFEMGLSLTGQSMIPTPAGVYLQSAEMKLVDQRLLALLKNEVLLLRVLPIIHSARRCLRRTRINIQANQRGCPTIGCLLLQGIGSAVANSTVAHRILIMPKSCSAKHAV